ncbi:hypothetical protein DFP83_105119 [Idiomarina fontislapidosi]|uniref:Uncharacterized protein n=1 Tax=Idiomarina fontislapidosi TaxID=263723 RepID=A0A432XYF7_9GAMM|nr:hypothetical protein [Idiomarina fontislapidosi]PYE32811.1 hypothetical protein DFP83_105119 [Idiomarina fontislapidosi]RUO53749.1 hypothetical protein CWE25_07620 [Idiomarina fontislapidosi]
MMTINYYEMTDLKNLYLEDSFVLSIDEFEGEIVFSMDFVLNENHPLYSEPSSEENYCYRKGKIKFTEPKVVRWIKRNENRTTDINGEVDFGNIDTFIKSDDEKYVLSGDWGKLEISPKDIIIEYE